MRAGGGQVCSCVIDVSVVVCNMCVINGFV